MKAIHKYIYLIIALFIVLVAFFSINEFTKNKDAVATNDNNDFKLKPGDIVITKGPVLYGFFGHSSIAIDEDTVLQIEGPGDKPITESFESYKHRFGTGNGLKFIVVLNQVLVKTPLTGLNVIMRIVTVAI